MSSERSRRSGSKTSLTRMNSSASVALQQCRQACAHRLRAADHGGREEVLDRGLLLRMQSGHEIGHRRLQQSAVAVQDAKHALVGAAGEEAGLLVGRSGDHRHADHHVGLGQRRRGPEQAAVEGDGFEQQAWRKVRGEGIGQAALGGQLRRKQAGAEQPDRHVGAGAGNRQHPLAG
jgi:hypothetical protein